MGRQVGGSGENEWVLTIMFYLDGIHTLTCALMLLNTDLHGHVSWGSIKGTYALTDS